MKNTDKRYARNFILNVNMYITKSMLYYKHSMFHFKKSNVKLFLYTTSIVNQGFSKLRKLNFRQCQVNHPFSARIVPV